MAAKGQASGTQQLPALAEARQGTGKLDLLAIGVIVLVTLPWWLATRGAFIPVDDPAYVTGRPEVLAGLSGATVKAAFSNAWAAFWLPVTFVSLMADVTVWGSGDLGRLAAGMHATNVLLHVANAVLVYLFLMRATERLDGMEVRGKWWRSLFAALLFAMHPLRVESVSWITERKDVLAGFFGLLAMLAWLQYVRAATRGEKWAAYGVVCVCFGLSLMSKPMLVTLPALLLVLDAWPLERVGGWSRGWGKRAGVLALEKVPLLMMSAAISVVTVMVQRQAGALVQLEGQGVWARVQNAVVSYALYLRDCVYVEDLSIYYPLRRLAAGEVAGAFAVLLVITAGAVLVARKWAGRGRAVLVGWLWFLGTLVPMIGVLQSGEQGRADRFTYFPSIGLALAVAWLWPVEMLKEAWQRKAAFAVAAGIVVVLTVYTTLRVVLWNDPLAMLQDGIEHTQKNAKLEYFVGEMMEDYQQPAEAIKYYRRAVFDAEGFPQAYEALGRVLVEQGQEEEGFLALDVARRLRPGEAKYEQTYQRMRELAAKRAATRSAR